MSIDDVIRRRPPAVRLDPVAAVITAVTEAGVFATPVGQPSDHPVGPCRGAHSPGTGAPPPGTHVLIVFAGTVPWIVSIDK